jgi:hypothetical protein
MYIVLDKVRHAKVEDGYGTVSRKGTARITTKTNLCTLVRFIERKGWVIPLTMGSPPSSGEGADRGLA